MRTNETGEFELVVGNKQLLSGFFIVVLLFAVAFAMGYVVGQNTQKSAKSTGDAGTVVNQPGNAPGDSRPQPVAPLTPATGAPNPDPNATQPAATGTETQPAAGAAASATQPAQPAVQPQPAPPPAVVEKPAPPQNQGIVPASELAAGSYWQVLAVKPEVAEAMRETLKGKGFQVALTPGTSNLTRVLAGPYSDSAAFGRAKTELENAGFHPVRYRRD
jgi:hypothetical protein